MKYPVDLSRFRKSIDHDTELERELIAEFVRSSTQLIKQLQAHCKGDRDEGLWRSSAHAFKGISLNLGALHLAEICKIAQDIFADEMSKKISLLEEIIQEHAKVVQYLKNLK